MKDLTPALAHPLARARFTSLRQDREVRAAMDRNNKRILGHHEVDNPAGCGGMMVVGVVVLGVIAIITAAFWH